MINKKLERVIKKADEIEVELDQKERYLIRKNIEIEIKYIQQIIQENPEITEAELREKLIMQMCDEQKEYIESAHISGQYYQLEAILTLFNDKERLKNIFLDLKEKKQDIQKKCEDFKATIYSSNHKESCKKIVEEAFVLFWMYKGKYKEVEKDIKKENKSRNKNKKTNKIGPGKRIINSIALCEDEPTLECIIEILLGIKEVAEGEIREIYIKSMEFVGDKFKRYNLLEKYKKENDRNFGAYNLDEYTYEVSTGKINKDEIGIEEVFSRKFLETLDLDQLSILSTYWQNRYAKECKNMGEALFAIDTLNLWKKIIKGEKIEITDKEVDLIYSKKRCLEEVSTMLLRNIADNNRNPNQEDKERGYCTVTGEKEVESIIKQESKNYKKIFDSKLRYIPNNLGKDLDLYKLILNYTENIYHIRNTNLCSMLRMLTNSKKSFNWGIIEDKNDKVDSEKYVLIGIDIEGFNMPVRLHIKRELLISLLKTHNGDTKIPIYEGASDFIQGNTLLPTNILMPLQKKQKQLINIKAQEWDGNSPLINHLRFLKDSSKYPEHLKIFDFKSKKKVRPPKQYKDIETGECFEKNKNEYVPIMDDGEKSDECR